ncbi:MAG TPA: SDR family NAD(P)-dependent oxidoreductase [Dehalococcoidia bacterium]|nr:SDR family NAD(P)-dependent oxidoreductase [Dehalococcoidia bacterium]
MELKGQVAIVTGASRGVGKGIAMELGRAGADVVVAARSEQEPDPRLPGTIYSTAEEVRAETGARVLPVRLDVSKDEEIEAMVEKTAAEFGRIDILVNNAGVMAPGPLLSTPIKRWDLLWRVNVRGPLVCAQAVLPAMIERKSGTIVFISSIAAERPGAGNMSYSVTKQADRKVAEGLALEVKEHGIRVFSLSPEGLILSPGVMMHRTDRMFPESEIEEAEEMGQAVVILARGLADDRLGAHFYSRRLNEEFAGA